MVKKPAARGLYARFRTTARLTTSSVDAAIEEIANVNVPPEAWWRYEVLLDTNVSSLDAPVGDQDCTGTRAEPPAIKSLQYEAFSWVDGPHHAREGLSL